MRARDFFRTTDMFDSYERVFVPLPTIFREEDEPLSKDERELLLHDDEAGDSEWESNDLNAGLPSRA